MDENKILQLRARNTQFLETRTSNNVASQEVDFVKWVFERLNVKAGSWILELCCGTGLQTLPFAERIGKKGQVVAVDVSKEALGKLASKLDTDQLSRLTLVEADMDLLSESLNGIGLFPPTFDLIFCAYGLYYSTDVKRTLQKTKKWLKPGGLVAIVGPYGPNNGPLFEVLEQSGVRIPDGVRHSSQSVMGKDVIPWAVQNFEKVVIDTMINRIKWSSADQILRYWENSTFYQEEKLKEVQIRLNAFFGKHEVFVNEKWIMMVQMHNARI
jgi:ubiquinone/menaquinone biosynthesis C-methylase UbiE